MADRAVITIGAQGRSSKPAEAKRLADDGMRLILTALRNIGIPDSAIRTTGYAVRPDYGERSKDYGAQNRVVVRVDAASVEKVLDAAGSAGASTTLLEFEIADRQAAEDEALKLAAEAALRRAKILANGQGAVRVRFVGMASGEIEVIAQVTLVVSVR